MSTLKNLLLILLGACVLASGPAWADCSTTSPPTCAYVSVGAQAAVTPSAFASPTPSCNLVTNNNCPGTAMIATGSQAEWTSFVNNHEACLTLASCAVNGACNTAKYTCTVGTVSAQSDISGVSTWDCNGSNGGTLATCSFNDPINGECGSGKYACEAGNAASEADNGTTSTWACNGSNGGSNISCSFADPKPVNGACSSSQWGCTTGTAANGANDGSTSTWTCQGTNGGTSASCSLSICKTTAVQSCYTVSGKTYCTTYNQFVGCSWGAYSEQYPECMGVDYMCDSTVCASDLGGSVGCDH